MRCPMLDAKTKVYRGQTSKTKFKKNEFQTIKNKLKLNQIIRREKPIVIIKIDFIGPYYPFGGIFR